jgi:hypothetical protein
MSGDTATTPTSSGLKRALFRIFLLLERAGIHVLPRHFYSSVADRHALRASPELWRSKLPMTGIHWDLEEQLGWLRQTCSPDHLGEVAGFSFVQTLAARGIGFRYGLVEGQVLHCAVRGLAPRRLIEVGSGASTAIISDALELNRAEGRKTERFVSVDPYAPPELKDLPGVEVLDIPGQTAPASLFEELSEGDLLFIDTTHVVKAGSELPRLYLDVLPGLPGGVTVHIHDIYLPYAYSPWILSDFWDWQETTLLAALLADNPKLEVLCCESALHDEMPERMREVLPDYVPKVLETGIDPGTGGGHFPSSIWLKTR